MLRLPVPGEQAVQAVQAQAPEQVQIQVPQKSQVQAPAPARVLPLRARAAGWVAQSVVPVQGAPPERGIARP